VEYYYVVRQVLDDQIVVRRFYKYHSVDLRFRLWYASQNFVPRRMLRAGLDQINCIIRFVQHAGIRPLGKGIHEGRRQIAGPTDKVYANHDVRKDVTFWQISLNSRVLEKYLRMLRSLVFTPNSLPSSRSKSSMRRCQSFALVANDF